MALTKDNILQELNKNEPLSKLLPVEEFAEPGKLADKLAEEFYTGKKPLNPTQLRKIFHAIKAIERRLKGKNDKDSLDVNTKGKIHLLNPELAYAFGRELIPEKFYQIMRRALSGQKLQNVEDFRHLSKFLTALLAYNKYYEKMKGR